VKEHYSNKGGHLERSLYNKALSKMPDNILVQRGEIKPNQIRHTQNIKVFSGFYHGTYFENGIARK
jgi:hypothetical protein